ncbi:MAG: ABC transporter permease [Spirochaetales bacterium]|nr:ABC transporter permease [Spirochaetales bacterium]
MKPGMLSYIAQSIIGHRRTNLGIFAGAVFSTAVLLGAMIVGDSLRYSLKEHTKTRLGKTEYILMPGSRFIRTSLADELSKELHTPTAPAVRLSGIVSSPDGTLRMGGVQIFGIDDRFWQFGTASSYNPAFSENEAAVNRLFVEKTGLTPGDTFLLRFRYRESIPYNVIFSEKEDKSVSLKLSVKDIVPDDSMGRFDLRIHQEAPLTVYLPLRLLSRTAGFPGKANLILIAQRQNGILKEQKLIRALKKVWGPQDAGIRFERIPGTGITRLTSERLFLPQNISAAGLSADKSARGMFTYFINTISLGDRTTPYSFVSAPGDTSVPVDMGDREIIISDWLARDLHAKKGDTIEFSYFIPASGAVRDGREAEDDGREAEDDGRETSDSLIEVSSSFTVRDIIPLEKIKGLEYFVPYFPGLTDAGTCADWNPGIDIDLSRIREKDEAYWNEYGAAPKAVVTLDRAQSMWSNTFGNLTAIGYTSSRPLQELEAAVMKRLDPSEAGFAFVPVMEKGLAAGSESVDFGGLFLGLSFFIILSTLLIIGLLFVFEVEYRSGELGLLKALGFRNGEISFLFRTEGLIIGAAGSITGGLVGILYDKLILYGLSTIWIGAVGTTSLRLYVDPVTFSIGILLSTGLSFLVMTAATGKLLKTPITRLQREGKTFHLRFLKNRYIGSILIIILCIAGMTVIVVGTGGNLTGTQAHFFMLTGALTLALLLAVFNLILIFSGKSARKHSPGIAGMGFQSLSHNRKRSITVAGILACGIFIIVTVGANRKAPLATPAQRSSGTGGFTLIGTSTLPIHTDLNTAFTGSFDNGMEGTIRFVAMNVHEGDDASCLNLNKIAEPQIIGVDPREFSHRHAFSFASVMPEVSDKNPWLILEEEDGDAVPAIADQTVITWGLGKAVGDTLTYLDERGSPVHIRLMAGLSNSIFQGNIIISSRHFNLLFPSEDGYRLFLADSPRSDSPRLEEILENRFRSFGLEMEPTIERLARFNVVENTYLSMFLMLGGLGLLIGTIGFGVLLLRNMAERKKEGAILTAIGLPRSTIFLIGVFPNSILLAAGILAGCLASFISLLPVIVSQGQTVPFDVVGIITTGIVVHGCIWVLLAARYAVKGKIIDVLRNE